MLKCLSAAHTLGNFAEMSFEVVKSLYSVRGFSIHRSQPLPPMLISTVPIEGSRL